MLIHLLLFTLYLFSLYTLSNKTLLDEDIELSYLVLIKWLFKQYSKIIANNYFQMIFRYNMFVTQCSQ